MGPAFSPSETDLRTAARNALAQALDSREKTKPGFDKNDFVAGYLAALSAHHIWSEFIESARSKLTGTTQSADGRAKMLQYLKQHPGEWVPNRDLRELTSLDDAPRKARALRFDEGWKIEASGDGRHRLNAP